MPRVISNAVELWGRSRRSSGEPLFIACAFRNTGKDDIIVFNSKGETVKAGDEPCQLRTPYNK